jgi:hypothetical protein
MGQHSTAIEEELYRVAVYAVKNITTTQPKISKTFEGRCTQVQAGWLLRQRTRNHRTRSELGRLDFEVIAKQLQHESLFTIVRS